MDEEYKTVSIKIRGQILIIYYLDYGMVDDETCLRERCIDWHVEEGVNFEFHEGEEIDLHTWLIKHIDGEPVPFNLEALNSTEFGDGE